MQKIACLLCLLILASCAKEDRLVLERTGYPALTTWEYQDKTPALAAFLQSCSALMKQPAEGWITMGSLTSSRDTWQALCQEAGRIDPSDRAAAHRFFEESFEPYIVSNNGDKTGLFTGYYEPLLKGSRRQYGAYRYPIYRLPPDLKAGEPYYRRDEIDRGALAGRGLEIAYVDDPVQAFFLHIQGSGRILMDDGSILRVGYAGKNNREYVAIGKYLKEKGYIAPDSVSAQSIKQWLYTHTRQAQYVMDMNPSYVFFRELADNGGPIGGQGVPLTARNSLAVDKRFIPYGVPLWLDTRLADGSPFKRLMVAQDTGGAIKGPVRGDIFFGFGAEAEHHAGLMQNKGSYVALWPKETAIIMVSRN